MNQYGSIITFKLICCLSVCQGQGLMGEVWSGGGFPAYTGFIILYMPPDLSLDVSSCACVCVYAVFYRYTFSDGVLSHWFNVNVKFTLISLK